MKDEVLLQVRKEKVKCHRKEFLSISLIQHEASVGGRTFHQWALWLPPHRVENISLQRKVFISEGKFPSALREGVNETIFLKN